MQPGELVVQLIILGVFIIGFVLMFSVFERGASGSFVFLLFHVFGYMKMLKVLCPYFVSRCFVVDLAFVK